ncbi:sugar ABC transporter permease [Clostridium sp. AM22-11AC]|jgi:oligogalacturonide transport system permease protein|uniref:carbohydrate ABC transporter permease n=2 Tax=Clostridia TaxID=186801 RepID=UPI000E4C5453|nr:sugar ABC transporter permease [Clostridium sp. AM22-11AC]RHO02182.1 sugar ABC transporter permease [Clostridium sp. AM22-11AC]
MNRKKNMKREYQAYLYILPWILGFAILQLYPFVSSFIYSFTDYTVGAKATFQGLANYKKLFTQDKEFWNSLKVTILFALYTVPGKLIMALAVAMFLNRDLKGINLIRTLYYIPSLFGGSVAVALLWRLMFLDNGVINAILSALHLPVIQWLGDTRYALRTICMLEIWQFGSSMVMFLAALKQVPRSLYEAAEIDGAGKVTRFFHITLPQISPIIFFNLINQTIQALQNFTSAQVITEGGPLKSTYVLGLKLYKEGFSYFKMGYASAISWVVFAAIMIFTLAIFASSKLWVHYADE